MMTIIIYNEKKVAVMTEVIAGIAGLYAMLQKAKYEHGLEKPDYDVFRKWN